MPFMRMPLSQCPEAYCGGPQYLEIVGFSPDIHDIPGLYLQHVEGCVYHPYELTPKEATKLGKALIEAASQVTETFKKGKAVNA